jgi:glutamate transport system substrate-binding protein
MRLRRLPALAALAALALTGAACGGDDEGDEFDSLADRVASEKKLVVGIKYDQPGLGLKEADGSYSGFDVEMAKIVARELGVPEDGITFKETISANRESFIEQGQVDIVVATYSITDERKEKVAFAGPYFVAGQSLLVQSDNTDITGPESLNNNKKLCSVTGSTPAQKIKDEYAENVQLLEQPNYARCVEALLGGQVDAVTTDDIILAGFAAQNPGKLKVVGETFSEEKYGIGLKKDDKETRDKINDAIQKSFDDGSWKAALESTVGPSGYEIPAEPPTLERY